MVVILFLISASMAFSVLTAARSGPVLVAGIVSCALVVSSCDGGERNGAEVAVSDSAGVRVVEYAHVPAGASLREGSLVLERRIGGSDAPEGEEMAFLRGLVALVGDHLFLADAAAEGIRGFRLPSGDDQSFGAEGQGPGEYLYPAVAGVLDGDSVVVYDGRTRRMTIVAPGGGYRIYTVPQDVGQFMDAAGVLSSGETVFSGSFGLRLERRERVVRETVPIVVVDRSGNTKATFGAVRTEGYFEGGPSHQIAVLAIPFMSGDLVAAGPSGIYVALEDRAEMRRFDHQGSLSSIVRFNVPGLPVTDAQVDSVREAEAEVSSNPEDVRRLFARMPIPEWHPPIDQILVDALGRVWLSFTARPEVLGPSWLVLSAEGDLLGSVALPPGRLVGVTRDRAVLMTYDAYDTPVIQVYRWME